MAQQRGGAGNRRSGVAAAALGAILPGLGHGYIGRWGRAALLVLPLLGLIALALVALEMPTLDLLGILVTPGALRGILAANVAIVVWRVVAVTDPYRLSRGDRSTGRFATVTLIALLVVLPHVLIAKYTLDAAHALDQVFVTGDVTPLVKLAAPAPLDPKLQGREDEVAEVADPSSVTSTTRRAVKRPLLFTEGVGDPDAVALPIRVREPKQRSLSSLLGSDYDGVSRLTILLVGGDAGPGRSGNRTDSIMVATFDTETGKSAVFGIPRDMTHVPIPEEWSTAFVELEKRLTPWDERRLWTDEDGDGEPDQFESCECFPERINAIYASTRNWVDTYPDEVDPGLAALRDTLEILLGLDIDYYAMVDMSGFVRLVDALGGVRTYVASPIETEVSPANEGDEWIIIDLEPGWHRLDGHEALAYVRERKSTSDYTRMTRQRCLLRAVAAQADTATVVRRFTPISRAFASSVRTDIPRELLPALLRHGSSLELADIATVGFVPPYYAPVMDSRGRPTPNLLRIRAIVRWALSAEAETEFDTGRQSECRV